MRAMIFVITGMQLMCHKKQDVETALQLLYDLLKLVFLLGANSVL